MGQSGQCLPHHGPVTRPTQRPALPVQQPYSAAAASGPLTRNRREGATIGHRRIRPSYSTSTKPTSAAHMHAAHHLHPASRVVPAVTPVETPTRSPTVPSKRSSGNLVRAVGGLLPVLAHPVIIAAPAPRHPSTHLSKHGHRQAPPAPLTDPDAPGSGLEPPPGGCGWSFRRVGAGGYDSERLIASSIRRWIDR